MPSGLFCANSLYTATGSFSLLFVAKFSVLKASHQRRSRRLVFSFAVRCTRHRPLFYSELPQHILWCSWIPRRPKWRLLFSQRELKSASGLDIPRRPLLYRTFISSSVTDTDADLACCLSLVYWAVFAWTAAFCAFSQTLNCSWY